MRAQRNGSLRIGWNDRTRSWVVIFLAALVIFVAWRFASPGVDVAALPRTAAAEGIQINPAVKPLIYLPEKPPAPSVPGVAEPTTKLAVADYDAEEFTHVPAWIPRLPNARAARAEDASLRSDGFLEGKVIFDFAADAADPLGALTSHFEAVGMHAEAAGSAFSSEDPSRRCGVEVKRLSEGGVSLAISYQGTDHGKACLCPTCDAPQDPEF